MTRTSACSARTTWPKTNDQGHGVDVKRTSNPKVSQVATGFRGPTLHTTRPKTSSWRIQPSAEGVELRSFSPASNTPAGLLSSTFFKTGPSSLCLHTTISPARARFFQYRSVNTKSPGWKRGRILPPQTRKNLITRGLGKRFPTMADKDRCVFLPAGLWWTRKSPQSG